MKKIVLFLSVCFIVFISEGCVKNDVGCQEKTVASEDAAMLSFAASNSITATKHSSGMYYQIINQGSGVSPTLSSTVKVKYTGKLINGTIFDQQIVDAKSFPLDNLVYGWKIGLPLISKGGTIKLIIPSSFGYGCTGRGPIPGYSILYFEIELIDVL